MPAVAALLHYLFSAIARAVIVAATEMFAVRFSTADTDA